MALKIKGSLNSLIQGGGTPLSFYQVQITGPFELNSDESTLCKAVSLPGLKKNTTDFWYGGVKYPIPREVQDNQTIELTFYQDLQDKLRKQFMEWMFEDNLETKDAKLIVVQYSDKLLKNKVSAFEMLNVFPTDISDIKVAYEKASELGEFTVTLSYSTMRG